MKASMLKMILERNIRLYGDLKIVGGYLSDDTPLRQVTVIKSDGCEVGDERGEAVGLFFEA